MNQIVFGELFGAGVFVTTIVAGSVAVTKPFKVNIIYEAVCLYVFVAENKSNWCPSCYQTYNTNFFFVCNDLINLMHCILLL